jgi:hypothetical protein
VTVVRVFHHQLLHPFHVRRVQAVQSPLNYECRKALSEWLLLLQQVAPPATLLNLALQTDGACLKRNLVSNTCKQ